MKQNNLSCKNKGGYLITENNPPWLKRARDKKCFDEDYNRIIDFYLIHSPCEGISYLPNTLESLGWKKPWNSSRFRALFDDIAGFEKDKNWWYDYSIKEFQIAWDESKFTDFISVKKEFAVISKYKGNNPRMDLLHHIRNSLAHGRFVFKKIGGEYYIYFEDVCKRKKSNKIVVSARMCLKKSTLIAWIDLFEHKSQKAEKLWKDLKEKEKAKSTKKENLSCKVNNK